MGSWFLQALLLAWVTYSVAANNEKKHRTKPDRGALVVDASGKYNGCHTTISSAVKSLRNTTNPQKIFIYPGIYTEQVYIPPLNGPLTIQGYTPNAHTYTHNTATLTFNLSRQTPNLTNNDLTATLRLWTPNTKIYNLNIANTFGPAETKGQALALSAQATNQSFYACSFTGYQDTIYANQGRQLYAKSYINGAVDFIFGQRASAWFHDSDIEAIGPGWITANGRDAVNNTSIFVFNECRVFGEAENSTYLGRPWRPYSRVVFQKSWLGDVVKAEEWARWDDVQSVEKVEFGEFENWGDGSEGERVAWSRELRKAVGVRDVLGRGEWIDEEYL